MSDKSSSSSIPSELRISKQWDFAIEQFIKNSSSGAIIAGIASIVIFRNRGARMAFTSLGFGFGAGYAFKTASYEFEKEKQQS